MSRLHSRILNNVSAPDGSRGAAAYNRFIPREELGKVSAWSFGDFDTPARAPTVTRAPTPEEAQAAAGPSEAEWLERIEQAREEGRQVGISEGLAELDVLQAQFVTRMTAQIGDLVQAFDGQLDALQAQMATMLSRSAVKLAERVLRGELQARPEHVSRLAEEAVEAVQLSARQVLVHVNPTDLPLVAEGAAQTLAARGARLVADAAIARGGCLVESDVGTVDATIEARWAHASASLGHPMTWAPPAPPAPPETRAAEARPTEIRPPEARTAAPKAVPSQAASVAQSVIAQVSAGESATAAPAAPAVSTSAAADPKADTAA